jgi:thiol-disulfide isomerase/thioredoxin
MNHMAFFDELGRKISKTSQGVVRKTRDFADTTKLGGLISDEESAEILDSFSAEMLENETVQSLKKGLDARLETSEGKMFKDFTVNSVIGHTRSIPAQPIYAEVKLSDYVGKGKYILLDFWSPWCGPCRMEMPNIKAVYDKYKGEKFDVVSIAVWEKKPVEVTIETAAKLDMTWNQINNAGREPAEIYGVEAIPHIILFGPDGTILKRGLHGAEIEAVVSQYVK